MLRYDITAVMCMLTTLPPLQSGCDALATGKESACTHSVLGKV